MKRTESDRIVRKVFLAFAPIQALSVALPGINALLNSLITGNFLGVTALAGVGFVCPYISLIAAVIAVMTSGAQIMCGRYLGRGDSGNLRSTFTTAALLCGACGLAFSLISCLFPAWLALLLGATGEMTEMTEQYILGMSPGFLFNALFMCLLPFLQMDNDKRTSTAAVVASLVVSVGFNVLNVTVLGWGLLGVGLSSSFGNLVSVVICLPHFIFHSETYRFSVKSFSVRNAKKILKQGYPASVNQTALALRDRILNQFVFAAGGSVAMSAVTVATNITTFILAVNGGYGGSINLVSSVLVGERDTESLRNMGKTVFKSFGWLYYAVYVPVFVFAKPIAALFGAQPDQLDVYAMAIRCVNMFMLTNGIKEVPLCLYRSLGKINLTSLFYVLNGLIFPVLVYVLGRNNLTLMCAAPPIAEILMILTYTAYYRIRAGRWPKSLLALTYIPDAMGISGENRYAAVIRNEDDAIRVSKEMCSFCEEKRLPRKTAMCCGLCLEEMAMNTLKHGFPEKDRGKYAIDVRMVYDGGISMMIRDDCPAFDPTAWLQMYANDDPTHSIGIRLVSKIAARMEYAATLGLNVMNIRLEAADNETDPPKGQKETKDDQ